MPLPTVDVTLAVEAHPASVGEARRFLRRTLSPEVEEDVLDVVLLLASEVITNAVIHAQTAGEVRVLCRETVVRIEVVDSSPRVPEQRVLDFESASGRGLAIVDAVAQRWGVDPVAGEGKRVWFEVVA